MAAGAIQPASYNSASTNVGSLLPSVSTLTGSTSASNARNMAVTPTQPATAEPDALSTTFAFLGGVGKAVGAAASWAAGVAEKDAAQVVTAVPQLLKGAYHLPADLYSGYIGDEAKEAQSQKEFQGIMDSYRTGKLNKPQYQQALKDWTTNNMQLGKTMAEQGKATSLDTKNFTQGYINTVGIVVSLMTMGAASPFVADADTTTAQLTTFLLGDNATTQSILKGGEVLDGYLGKAVQGIDVAKVWGGLKSAMADKTIADTAIKAPEEIEPLISKELDPEIQKITSSTLDQGGATITTAQQMKNVASALLIQRPLLYNTAVGTVEPFVKDMSSGKYGAAAQQVGWMAALTLSGGPIGAALKYGGEIGGKAVKLAFGEPTVMETLSKLVGDGDSKGIFNVFQQKLQDNPEEATQDLKDWKAMEDTNLKMQNGSVVGAAHQIADWFPAQGISLQDMTHEELVESMLTMAKTYREGYEAYLNGDLTGDAAVAAREGRLVFTRATIPDKNILASMVTDADKTVTDGTTPTVKNVSVGDLTNYEGAPDRARVEQVKADIAAGKPVEPIRVARDSGGNYGVEDGKHRLQAVIESGGKTIPATGDLPPDVAAPSSAEVKQYAQTFGVSQKQARAELTKTAQDSATKEATQNVAQDKFAARQRGLERLQNTIGGHSSMLNSKTFVARLHTILGSVENTDEAVKQIMSIKAGMDVEGVPDDLSEKWAQRGYTASGPKSAVTEYSPYQEGSKIKSQYTGLGSEFFQKTQQRIPVLGELGGLLTKAGLSPYNAASATQTIFNQNVREGFEAAFGVKATEAPVGIHDADAMLNQLSSYVKDRNLKVYDLRQLKLGEIQNALSVSRSDARKIGGILNTAILKVPLEIRGFGDRLTDINYAYNPASGIYARIQGAAKFTFNPFFRLQQSALTETVSQATAGGKELSLPGWNEVRAVIFPGQAADLDSTVQFMEQQGLWTPGFSGQGAEDIGAIYGDTAEGNPFGKIGSSPQGLPSRVIKSEKLSMAGMINTLAQKAGTSPQQYILDNRDDVENIINSFVHYPKGANFINSPLARTLNVAIFPFRFNAKITGVAAKLLADQNPLVQVAVIHGVMNFDSWYKSDEGLAWQQKYADGLQVFNWLSPLYPINNTLRLLGVGHESISDLGSLGGLPFGIISQLLGNEGLINIDSPYVEPSSGQEIPKYIPSDAKSQASVAIQSLLGSLFTYPGATIGLPSKSGILRDVTDKESGITTAKDYKTVTPPLNSTEQHDQNIWQSNSGTPTTKNGTKMNLYKGPYLPMIKQDGEQAAQTPQGLAEMQESFTRPVAPKSSYTSKDNMVVAPPS